MSVQKYIFNNQSGNFTVIPNKIIEGLNDQLELLGLYVFLVHLPPTWEFHKSHIKETCGMGIKKLDNFLNKLAQHGLLQMRKMRKENGTFAHLDITVLNGDLFKINNLNENAQPRVNIHPTVNHSTVKNTYKRNIDKTNIEKRNKELSCATENIAHDRFDEFWSSYPKKKDKVRAKKIWERKKYDEKADLILEDIKNRLLNDQQWQNKQYIPHPSTYLNNELWTDEYITKSSYTWIHRSENKQVYNPNEQRSTYKFFNPEHESLCKRN